jgi:hypothetical protein
VVIFVSPLYRVKLSSVVRILYGDTHTIMLTYPHSNTHCVTGAPNCLNVNAEITEGFEVQYTCPRTGVTMFIEDKVGDILTFKDEREANSAATHMQDIGARNVIVLGS